MLDEIDSMEKSLPAEVLTSNLILMSSYPRDSSIAIPDRMGLVALREHTKQSQSTLSTLTDHVVVDALFKNYNCKRRWSEVTGQPKDPIILQQAKCLLEQWQADLNRSGIRSKVWGCIDELFARHRVLPWTAAQFFVHQVEGLSSDPATHTSDQCRMLKVNGSRFKAQIWRTPLQETHNASCGEGSVYPQGKGQHILQRGICMSYLNADHISRT